MPTYLTPNRHGYSVRFSPFQHNRLICSTSQFYGLTGGGTLFVLDILPNDQINEFSIYEWQDGMFDVVWSETDPNIVVAASGDGILHIWNVSSQVPAQTLKEHKKEIYSVDWSQTRQEQLVLSASWDCTIKLWDPLRYTSLCTYLGHSQLVYNAMWSPHVPSCFASVSGDGTLRIWNAKVSQKASMTLKAHEAEILTCSWCKFDHNLLATGGSDGLIRGWDIRSLASPIFELKNNNATGSGGGLPREVLMSKKLDFIKEFALLIECIWIKEKIPGEWNNGVICLTHNKGCEYAVRRIQFSPHYPSVLASVSYDFTTRIWDFKASQDSIEIIRHHSEFVYGLDFNNHVEGQIVDCGWDSLVHVFIPRSLISLSSY